MDGFGYYNQAKAECSVCPGNCITCQRNDPEKCSECDRYYILDPDTRKCFDCTDETRPKHLITKECPELYELYFRGSEFKDNDSFFEVYIDREILNTKSDQNDGLKIRFEKLDWASTLQWWITAENEQDKVLMIDHLDYHSDDFILNNKTLRNKQFVKFFLTPGQLIHHEFNKKIKVKYIRSFGQRNGRGIHILNYDNYLSF